MSIEHQADRERFDALSKWARRVVSEGATHQGPEARRTARMPMNAEIALVPLSGEKLRPDLDRRTFVVGKDISDTGLGVIANAPLVDELYFAMTSDEQFVLLVRKARERLVRGSIREYGFMIVDRYNSFGDLTRK